LWGCFLSFSTKCIFSGRSPLYVDDQEKLGRWLFSGHFKKKKIQPNAFMGGKTRGISVSRLAHAPLKFFTQLGLKERERRAANVSHTVNFYGYAVIAASDVRSVDLDSGDDLVPKGSPTLDNPLHADILRPSAWDKDKDLELAIADALLKKAKHEPYKP
jgi:hypothetical protein